MARRELFEFTQYHSPDGEIYHFDTHELFLLSSTGYGLSPIKYLQQRGPFQHGNTIYDYRLEPRVIQLVHRAQGCDRDEYWDKRSTLIDLLRPNRQLLDSFNLGKLRKIFSDGTMKDIDVMIEQGPIFVPRDTTKWDEWAFTETLRFIAPDPTFYDPSQQSIVWTLQASNELNFEIRAAPGTADDGIIFGYSPDYPEENLVIFGDTAINTVTGITYEGTWFTYPTIVVTGPTTGFLIENQTTDEKLSYTRSITSGETVTVNLSYGNKSVTSDIYGNMIGYLSSDSDLGSFHLAPDPEATDGINQIFVTVPDPLVGTTVVSMTWYKRYIGI